MPVSAETQVAQRQILLVGPDGVLGTGVVDAVAENPKWGITTAARRAVPTYQAQTAPSHISVDLLDREGTTKAFSALDKVTDLVFAAYVEKPTMAETVEPNSRMLKTRSTLLPRAMLIGHLQLMKPAVWKTAGTSAKYQLMTTRALSASGEFQSRMQAFRAKEISAFEQARHGAAWAPGHRDARHRQSQCRTHPPRSSPGC